MNDAEIEEKVAWKTRGADPVIATVKWALSRAL